MNFWRKKAELITAEQALPGRSQPIPTADRHFVSGHPLKGPYPAGLETVVFALGCYWGAERKFWQVPGVWVTAVGNAGGFTPNPSYEEVCSGLTGHAEAVLVVYDPAKVSFESLLKVFWEAHDPTQGMRQGNDVGTQYRSAIFCSSEAQRVPREAVTNRLWCGAEGARAGRDHHHHREARCPSISPRPITSSIWPRTPTVIAGWAAPASPARSVWALRPDTKNCIAKCLCGASSKS